MMHMIAILDNRAPGSLFYLRLYLFLVVYSYAVSTLSTLWELPEYFSK